MNAMGLIQRQLGLLSILMVFISLFIVQASFAQTVDYRFVIRYALKHSPVLDASAKQVHISHLQRKNAFASFLPSLDFSNTIGVGHGATSSYPDGSEGLVDLSVQQQLFNNGDNLTNYHKSQLQQCFDQLQYQQDREQLILDVLKNYLDYSLDVALLQLNQKIYTLFQQQYVTAKNLYWQGMKTQTDELNLQIQAASAKLSVITSQQSIKAARHQLLNTIGFKGHNTWQLSPILQLTQHTQQRLVPLMLKQYRQYKLLEIQQVINRLNIDLKRHLYRPNVVLTAGGNYANGANVAGPLQAYGSRKQWGWYSELKLDFNLFDAGTRWRNIEIAGEQADRPINQSVIK